VKSQLEQRFAAEREAYDGLKAQTEQAVAKWRFSRGQLWSFYANDASILTTEEVVDEAEAEYAYGYDAAERVVCIRRFTNDRSYQRSASGALETIHTKRIHIEFFVRYAGETMEISEFSLSRQPESKKTLLRIYRVFVKQGKIVEKGELHTDRFDHEQYFWEDNFLKMDRSFDENGKIILETEYAPDGTFKMYKIRKDGSRFLLDQPLPKGVTIKSLIEVVRQRLVTVVPEKVKAARILEPVYCIALAYDGEGNDVLGPYLGIGLESERNKWLAERGKDAWQMIWNPAEFKNYEKPHTQLEDEELEEASSWLNGALANKSSTAPAIKLLVEVASELEKMDWSKTLKTTPDFVVYAVDFELGDLRKNLKKIVSAEKLSALKGAKLI
jgi:YD repeat-containing protein